MQGYVALCSQSWPGLVTSKEPVEVTYNDGEKGMSWIGIHLDPERFGGLWMSRNPKPLYKAYLPNRCVERPE